MIETIVVLAGGPIDTWPSLEEYKKSTTKWIGVDRGAYRGLKLGLPVTHAVGDFDSLSKKEFDFVKDQISDIHLSPSEKDDTDTALGILLAQELSESAEVILIGATGGRLDHFLSNLWLPLNEKFKSVLPRLTIKDNQNTIEYYLPGEYVIQKEADKPYVAFVCLVPVNALSLYDAKYKLDKKDVLRPMSYSSNEFVGETARFSFETGVICIIQSKDN